jgi:multiple antibiotic resistance protein
METLFQIIKVAVALFIITDSIGNLPFFMGLTEGATKDERRKIFSTAILTGFLMIVVFALAGTMIFDLFDLTIDDVRIAGGILLMLISVEILIRGKINYEHKEDIGIVPLGCPLLVGPGAITTVLMMLRIYSFYAVAAGVLACFFLIWLVLHFSENIYSLLGKNGSLVITKIAGILMAAIAVRFIRLGIQAIFHL